MKVKYLLIVCSVLTGILYTIFYSDLLSLSVLGRLNDNSTLVYNPICSPTVNYCRTLGYPFLQNIFLFFNLSASALILFQLFLFVFSCVFLANEFYRLTNQKILSYLLFFSIWLNPKIFKHAFTITEEGVFISLIAIVVALIIRFSKNINLKTIILLSFIVGIAITIKPIAYAILPLLLIILLFYWNRIEENKIKILLSFFMPVFFVNHR